jgi:hypothetical protein
MGGAWTFLKIGIKTGVEPSEKIAAKLTLSILKNPAINAGGCLKLWTIEI